MTNRSLVLRPSLSPGAGGGGGFYLSTIRRRPQFMVRHSPRHHHRWIEDGRTDGRTDRRSDRPTDRATVALLRPVFPPILAALMERRSKLFTPPKFVFAHSFSSWAHNPIEGGRPGLGKRRVRGREGGRRSKKRPLIARGMWISMMSLTLQPAPAPVRPSISVACQ